MARTRLGNTTDGGLSTVPRGDCPPAMGAAAEVFERRFGVAFTTLTLFPDAYLAHLHADDPDAELPPAVKCDVDPGSLAGRSIATMTRVANGDRDIESRRMYAEALHALYASLRADPRDLAADDATLCVGPQREGAQLASSMGCLPSRRSLTPHAKRIPYDGGLLVGLSHVVPARSYERCLVIDGAIATGATLIALARSLRAHVGSIEVFAAHAAHAGLRGLTRYAEETGIDLTVHVAAVSGVLNEKYYAVDPTDRDKLIMGDVGDTIADLLPQVEMV
jgi:hypothetical protein